MGGFVAGAVTQKNTYPVNLWRICKASCRFHQNETIISACIIEPALTPFSQRTTNVFETAVNRLKISMLPLMGGGGKNLIINKLYFPIRQEAALKRQVSCRFFCFV